MNITLHLLNALPFNAMNRDESGAPKHYYQGGVMRGQVSSQAYKRSIRKQFETYELAVDETAYRTGTLPQWTLDRVKALAGEAFPTDEKQQNALLIDIDKSLGALNRKPEKKDNNATESEDEEKPKNSSKGGKLSQQISLFVSLAEAELLALRYAESLQADRVIDPEAKEPRVDVSAEVLNGSKTGSLAIAAMGRMFAFASHNSVHAAVAVSDLSFVHETNIEVDYFTTVADQMPGAKAAQGATFLAEQAYTTGVGYRSVTIDVQQLRRSWTGWDREDARDQVTALVECMIRAVPAGKKNSTGAFTAPVVVLAEQQRHRQNYHFETPVLPGDNGGYDRPAAIALANQVNQSRRFDPNLVKGEIVGGTVEQDVLDQFPSEQGNLDQIRDQVVEWIMAEVAAK